MNSVTPEESVFLVVTVILILLFLGASFGYNLLGGPKQLPVSPYTGKPLRPAMEIYWEAKEKVLKYLFQRQDFANRIIAFNRAALCRDTGRIFPNCVTWYGQYNVDWSFIRKHFPGHYVSWGSLSKDQQNEIREKHGSLEGYQTQFSSQNPSPRQVEEEYAYMKPGPLYIDTETGILIGWKCVPDTELEVLVVQRPLEQYLPGIHKKY